MSQSLKNIGLKDFRRFLLHQGLTHIRTKGIHDFYSPPMTIVKNILYQN
jgi:predicted RNA binding protein YcfA (HicA-like mRNA interferase family)